MSVNREAWLSAVQDVAEPLTDDPDALTVAEFAALYHCGNMAARSRLYALEAEGRVKPVTKWITDRGGRRLRIRAFSLVKGTSEPNKARRR